MWDLLMVCLIIYYAFAAPMRVGFNITPHEDSENVLTFIFAADIVLNFFTGYYDKGTEVRSKLLIAKEYVRFWFWVDVVATIPFEYFVPESKGAGSTVKVLYTVCGTSSVQPARA
jgi:hypothetical protein